MIRNINIVFFVFSFTFVAYSATAQHHFLFRSGWETKRDRQLQMIDTSDASMMVNTQLDTPIDHSDKNKLRWMPLYVDGQFNSSRPYGWNNGSMLQSRGWQHRVASGFKFDSKYLSLVVCPEWGFASNNDYTVSNYFGVTSNKPQSWFLPGQSMFSVKWKKLMLGASTAQLWWGPGQFSALMFSTNGPGFNHLFFKSSAPVASKIGSFEWNVLVGRLEDLPDQPVEAFRMKMGSYRNQWRYLNTLVFTYQPKWVPGFYLGITRALQLNGNSLGSLKLNPLDKYLPVVTEFFKGRINTQEIPNVAMNDLRDQQASLVMRYVFPKEHFEFYLEYGYGDFKANLRDFIIDPQHSAAYILGLRKVFNLDKLRYTVISAELTQVGYSSHFLVRNANAWYTHGIFGQGFNHRNQILGAGSGRGNNVQTIQWESVKGLNRYGIKLQRIQNDPNGQFTNFNSVWVNPLDWTDYSMGLNLNKTFGRVQLKTETEAVFTENFAWLKNKKLNFFCNFGLAYRW